ncbi:MAG TPA: hypothetical protein VMC79_02270, partial [Rectinemataceae bacterium]|nr:hypothetical protein [Rectinemataceae bacterium]
MKKLGIALILLAAILLLGSCDIFMGKDGKVYGGYDWYDYEYIYGWGLFDGYPPSSGFPNGASYATYYQVSPGSYYFWYQLSDGDGTWYPGGTAGPDSNSAFFVEYTVTANK